MSKGSSGSRHLSTVRTSFKVSKLTDGCSNEVHADFMSYCFVNTFLAVMILRKNYAPVSTVRSRDIQGSSSTSGDEPRSAWGGPTLDLLVLWTAPLPAARPRVNGS